MKPKKVIYISPNGYFGGAERFVLNACIGHMRTGEYEPTILFFNDGEFREMAESKGIRSLVLNNSFRLKNPFQVFKATREISRILYSEQPDIVNSTMPYSQLMLNLSKVPNNIVKVWFQHGPVGGTLDKICALTQVDHIFFNTAYLKNEHEKMPNRKEPTFGDSILHYGIDTQEASAENIATIRLLHSVNENQILLVLAGRICAWKGYETVLLALNQILAEDKKNLEGVKVLLIGEAKRESDKEYEETLHVLAKKLIEFNILEFISFKENLHEYLGAADIFIHSSNIPEPFGLVVAEAMSQSTLVFGGSVGGVQEILKDGNTGYSFNAHLPSAVNELKEKLRDVLKNYKNHNGFADIKLNAKKLISKEYSIERMTHRLETKYSELIINKNGK